jgi:hypothetical protein
MARLGRELGITKSAVRGFLRRDRVTHQTEAVMRRLHEELRDQRPEEHGVSTYRADRARDLARQHGWPLPGT